MNSLAFLFLVSFKFISVTNDQSQEVIKASYLGGDPSVAIGDALRYPNEALRNNISGDVILSFVIRVDGRLDSASVVSSQNALLSSYALASINTLEKPWKPATQDGKPIDRNYLMIFRYRIYLDTQPPQDKRKAEKYFEKGKYYKALELYDKAIKENLYDADLFESRAKVKVLIGDNPGAEQDKERTASLQNTVMSVIDIVAVGVSRSSTTTTRH